MNQYLRRDCVEIRDLPIDSKQNSNNLVLKIAEKIGIDIKESDISVSHILPRRNFVDQSRLRQNSTEAIIIKFLGRDIKDKFYRARKNHLIRSLLMRILLERMKSYLIPV